MLIGEVILRALEGGLGTTCVCIGIGQYLRTFMREAKLLALRSDDLAKNDEVILRHGVVIGLGVGLIIAAYGT